MDRLITGLQRFQNDVFPQHRQLFERLYRNQEPHCLFITCADSRVVPNLLLQAEPGELFVLRNVGNVVPPPGTGVGGTISGIEYAVDVLRVRDIVLCGHSNCGAMGAILHPESVAHLPGVSSWVRHGDQARDTVDRLYPGIADDEKLDRLVEQNVILQRRNLLSHACVRAAVDERRVTVHGWVYDILTGSVRALDPSSDAFHELRFDDANAGAPREVVDLDTGFSPPRAG